MRAAYPGTTLDTIRGFWFALAHGSGRTGGCFFENGLGCVAVSVGMGFFKTAWISLRTGLGAPIGCYPIPSLRQTAKVLPRIDPELTGQDTPRIVRGARGVSWNNARHH